MSFDSAESADFFEVPSGVRARGRLRAPSSKSLTQRYLNLGLLSEQPVVLSRALIAEDTILFIEALRSLGMSIRISGDEVSIEAGQWEQRAAIHCGHNGTMLRFLTGALTTRSGIWVLDGSPRLRQRPIGPLVTGLRQLGARIDFLGERGFAPIRVSGGALNAGRVELDAGLSSQFASSMLMAAVRAEGDVLVALKALTSATYLELTVACMRQLGAGVETLEDGCILVHPGPLVGGRVMVEPDYSSAAYAAAAALLTAGSVKLDDLQADSQQGDRDFLDVLEEMGAVVAWQPDGVQVTGVGKLVGLDADMRGMPDQVPTLAALAIFADGRTSIRNVGHLRLKESDRIDSMCRELRRIGAAVTEHEDGLTLEGGWRPQRESPRSTVRIRTYGDHRIAMSMALVGLCVPGLEIENPGVVNKSYPDFWHDLGTLIEG